MQHWFTPGAAHVCSRIYMAHNINSMVYVGDTPWHGLGVRLPARSRYEEIVQAAGFYDAVERDRLRPAVPHPSP